MTVRGRVVVLMVVEDPTTTMGRSEPSSGAWLVSGRYETTSGSATTVHMQHHIISRLDGRERRQAAGGPGRGILSSA
jgi:hypothetical protein